MYKEDKFEPLILFATMWCVLTYKGFISDFMMYIYS